MKGAKGDRAMAKANGVTGHGSLKVTAMAGGSGNSNGGNPHLDGPGAAASSAVVKASEVVAKGAVWLETVDGDVEDVEREVAVLSPVIHREMLRFGRGAMRDSPVALPKQVSSGVLKLILEYCRFHRVPGRSDKERKLFDERFIRLDTRRLCELTSAADSLDMKPLVDLTSRALARMIEGKTAEEIRETFHLPDDLTEEEKLEPVKNATDDPRIRLLNRLYARKREELQKKRMLKGPSADADDKPRDERSVDDLLSFIENEGMAEGKKSGKGKKRKNRRKKEQADEACTSLLEDDKEKGNRKDFARAVDGSGDRCTSSRHEEESTGGHYGLENGAARDCLSDGGVSGNASCSLTSTAALLLASGAAAGVADGDGQEEDGIFDEADFDDDDGLDPAMKEKLDREVEDFARRLNSDWQDRMQEILALASSSHELRQRAMTGGGSSLSGQPVRSASDVDKRAGKVEGDRRHPPLNDMRKEKERLHRKIKKMKKLQKQQQQQLQQQQQQQQEQDSVHHHCSNVGQEIVQQGQRPMRHGDGSGEDCFVGEREPNAAFWPLPFSPAGEEKTVMVVAAAAAASAETAAVCGVGQREEDGASGAQDAPSSGWMNRTPLYLTTTATLQPLGKEFMTGDPSKGASGLLSSALFPQSHMGVVPSMAAGWHYYAAGSFMNGVGNVACREGIVGGTVSLTGGFGNADGAGHGTVGPLTLVAPVMNGFTSSSYAYIPPGGGTAHSLPTTDGGEHHGTADGARERIGIEVGWNPRGTAFMRLPSRDDPQGWLTMRQGGCESESIGGLPSTALSKWVSSRASLRGEAAELVSFLELFLGKIDMQDEVEVVLKGVCNKNNNSSVQGVEAACDVVWEPGAARVKSSGEEETDESVDDGNNVEKPESGGSSITDGEAENSDPDLGVINQEKGLHEGRLTGEGWTMCHRFGSGMILSLTLVDACARANGGVEEVERTSQARVSCLNSENLPPEFELPQSLVGLG